MVRRDVEPPSGLTGFEKLWEPEGSEDGPWVDVATVIDRLLGEFFREIISPAVAARVDARIAWFNQMAAKYGCLIRLRWGLRADDGVGFVRAYTAHSAGRPSLVPSWTASLRME